MPNLTQLRLAAREIFEDVLRAVDPSAAVRSAVRIEGSDLTICDRRFPFPPEADVFAVAIGKAATTMAFALDEVLGDRLIDGVLAAPRRASYRWQYFEGGHPLPNDASLEAAKAAFRLLKLANHQSVIAIFLISGGGSAMLEWPISDEMTLDDLRVANRVLIKSGASIAEINSVRRAFSAVKGGRLAECAPNCDQITLIVSDVPAGEERNVASGPTLAPSNIAPDATEVIARYDLGGQIPVTVLRAVDAQSEIPVIMSANSTKLREHFVLLENNDALQAAAGAATRRGFSAEIANDISDEPIEVGCEKLLARLRNMRESNPARMCLISGGEFACPVKGNGIGGRNLENALRLAIAANSTQSRFSSFVALCAGTDGIDGNSPAAGAIVDHTTIDRALKIGLDPQDFLDRSDTYSFFVALGDAITTGPTGTNVRDLRILLTGE
jgi:hydroxypyruvate reductase